MANTESGSMKNKLVTLIGGGGFVGRYAVRALLVAGARVRVAQRDPRHAWFLRTQGGLGQTQFVAADVTRPDTIARAVAGSDVVVSGTGLLLGWCGRTTRGCQRAPTARTTRAHDQESPAGR